MDPHRARLYPATIARCADKDRTKLIKIFGLSPNRLGRFVFDCHEDNPEAVRAAGTPAPRASPTSQE